MNCDAWAALLECARTGDEPRAGLLAHLETCHRCQQRFERERALTAGFSGLRQAASGMRSGADRHAELLRKYQAIERPRRGAIWAIAIAAMLLAGVAVVGTQQVRSRSELAENVASVDDDGYSAVPFAVPLATGEFVRVVQADLPASSLVQMGLDFDAETADAIPVDLVVGEDGLPRAVRLSRDEF